MTTHPKSLRPLLVLLLKGLSCLALHAGVTPYPDPPNATVSSVFTLTVAGTPVTVMKYMDYHYAHFAFDGTVSATVGTTQTITSHKISPASLGIAGQVDSDTNLTFTMDQVADDGGTPRYLVFQINSLEKLVILGDPPETGIPAASGPGIFNVVADYGADNTGATYAQPAIQNAVNAANAYGTQANPGIVYVPPGLYMVRANLLLRSNVDFYLAPGAVLKSDEDIANYTVSGGTLPPVLTVNNADNVTIRGRGEVDASGIVLMNLKSLAAPVFVQQSTAHPRRRIIRTNNNGTSRNVLVDGVLLKDASGWSLELKRTLGVRAQNVKVLNHKDIRWKIENDGINVCSSSDALVNQCFVMTIDDAMCSKATDRVMQSMDNVQFTNNVVWTWAAGVKAGMQNDHPMNGVVFRNIDVVHCRRVVGLDTKTSQDIGLSIPIEGILFDHIRTDEIESHWNSSSHDAVDFLLEDAVVNNITVRNLTLPKKRPIRCGPNYQANNVRFENLVMDSELITNVSQVTLAGSKAITNLVFAVTLPEVTLGGPATHANAGFDVTATFTEPVTGLTPESFAVRGGSAAGLTGGPSVYTLAVEPSSPGWVTVSLPAGAARNPASLASTASNELGVLGTDPAVEVFFADDFNRVGNPTVIGQTTVGDRNWVIKPYNVTGSGPSQYGIGAGGRFVVNGLGGMHDPGVAWVDHDLEAISRFTASFTFSFPNSTNSSASFLIFPRFDGNVIPGNPGFVLRTSGQDAPVTFRVFDYRGAPLNGVNDQHISTSGLTDLTASGPLPVIGASGERIVYHALLAIDGNRASLTLNGDPVGSIDLSAGGNLAPDYLGFGYIANGASNRALQVHIDDLVVSAEIQPGPGFTGFMAGFESLTEAGRAAGADPDGDGIVNLLEYALAGMDPTAPDVPPALQDNSVSFTKRTLAVDNDDVTYLIETSTTLGEGSWEEAAPVEETAAAISYTLPGGLPRTFIRLRVARKAGASEGMDAEGRSNLQAEHDEFASEFSPPLAVPPETPASTP